MGTSFNVRAGSSADIEVTVVEGSVRVQPVGLDSASLTTPVELGAGEHVSIRDRSVTRRSVSTPELADILAWRQGQIVFKGTPLPEALARFAHHHGRGITVGPDAAELRIGGRFGLDDLDGFFAALQQALPVTAISDASGNIQVNRRHEP